MTCNLIVCAYDKISNSIFLIAVELNPSSNITLNFEGSLERVEMKSASGWIQW